MHPAPNGSLWSIPFEVYAYLALAALFLVGALRFKPLPIAILLLILIDPIASNKLLFTWLPQNFEITLLAPCFAAGSLLAYFKHKISINTNGMTAAWLLYFLLHGSSYNFYFLYFAIFYSILHLSSQPFFLKIKPRIDISYGIYLWGWPTQQVMAQYFSHLGIGFNQASSITISIGIGYISWKLIEHPFIKFGANLGKQISTRIDKGNGPKRH